MSPSRRRRVRMLVVVALVSGSACSDRVNRYVRQYDAVTIRAVTIVDVDSGRLIADRDVLIRDGKIHSIVATSRTNSGATTIDGRGRFLLPGLADMHVHHYTGDDGAEPYGDEDLFLYLVNGVTTVRNMTGSERDLRAKRDLASGRIIGPRYYTSGPHLGRSLHDPASARAAVEEQHRAGYDFIKVYSGLTRPVFRAITETADRLNMKVAGHPQVRLGEDENLRLDSIEHLEESLSLFGRRSPDSALHAPFARRLADAGVFVTPTLHISTFYDCVIPAGRERLLRRPETGYLSDYWYDRLNNERDAMYRNLGRAGYRQLKQTHDLGLQFAGFLHRHGVRLLLGTDTVAFAVPGFSAHDELELLVGAGLSPRDALVTATSNVSDFFGPRHNSGRIEVGARSDVVLLDANPFADIKNTRRIAGVMIGRHWIDREARGQILDKMRKR